MAGLKGLFPICFFKILFLEVTKSFKNAECNHRQQTKKPVPLLVALWLEPFKLNYGRIKRVESCNSVMPRSPD